LARRPQSCAPAGPPADDLPKGRICIRIRIRIPSPRCPEAPPLPRHTTTARRVLLSLLTLGVLYANVAVMLSYWRVPCPQALRPPAPAWVGDAFLIFGVFSRSERVNRELMLWSVPPGSGDRPQDWHYLRVGDYMPYKPGEQTIRAWHGRQQALWGDEAQRAAWARMARQVRLRHNRLHPDRPIQRVAIGEAVWPIGPAGFRAGKQPEQTQFLVWFTEP
jgi:hypothetical protein